MLRILCTGVYGGGIKKLRPWLYALHSTDCFEWYLSTAPQQRDSMLYQCFRYIFCNTKRWHQVAVITLQPMPAMSLIVSSCVCQCAHRGDAVLEGSPGAPGRWGKCGGGTMGAMNGCGGAARWHLDVSSLCLQNLLRGGKETLLQKRQLLKRLPNSRIWSKNTELEPHPCTWQRHAKKASLVLQFSKCVRCL